VEEDKCSTTNYPFYAAYFIILPSYNANIFQPMLLRNLETLLVKGSKISAFKTTTFAHRYNYAIVLFILTFHYTSFSKIFIFNLKENNNLFTVYVSRKIKISLWIIVCANKNYFS